METIYGKLILNSNMNINAGKLNVWMGLGCFLISDDITTIALQLEHLYVQQTWTPWWSRITNIIMVMW